MTPIIFIIFIIPLIFSKNIQNESDSLITSFLGKKFPIDPIDGLINISPIQEIQPGMGYSSDTQSLAKAVCYKTETVIRSGQSSTLRFEEASDYKSFLKTFNMESDIKGGYGIFSTNDFFKYLHNIEEDSYTLSVNYFQKVAQNVMMTFSYNPKTILTEVGQNLYENGSNPMFRLLCGDTLVTSYEEGAILIFSFLINFTSKEEKNEFSTRVGLNIGSFIDASTTISTAASKYNLSGRIEILAFQIGGDPTQLSKLLASSVIDCDIMNIKACQDTAKNLIEYVSKIFPSQFKRDDHGLWVSPLVPLTSIQKDYLVSDIGLKLSPSYVTNEVEDARNDLLNIKNKIDYYYTNLVKLIEMYPVKLDTTLTDYQVLLEKNLNLLNSGDGLGKAIDCFVFPFKCIPIYSSLKSKLILNYEQNLVQSLNQLGNYTIFEFTFNKYECLPNEYFWTEPWKLVMTVYPIGNSKYTIIFLPTELEYQQNEVNDLGNFGFIVKNEYISYNISVASSNVSQDLFSSTFRCIDNQMGIDMNYSIKGKNKKNSLVFEDYHE